MKIAVSASGQNLGAEVDPRFGRCQYFIIADPDTMQFEALDNSNATDAGGAGISAAQTIVEKDVQAVLTGNCGPNAYQVLSSAGIQVITNVSGKVKDVVDDYRSGKLKTSASANVPDHFGMDKGIRRNMDRGMGMGRGIGRGMGMGRDMILPISKAPKPQSREQELELLKVQSKEMAQQLDDIQRRINYLENKRK